MFNSNEFLYLQATAYTTTIWRCGSVRGGIEGDAIKIIQWKKNVRKRNENNVHTMSKMWCWRRRWRGRRWRRGVEKNVVHELFINAMSTHSQPLSTRFRELFCFSILVLRPRVLFGLFLFNWLNNLIVFQKFRACPQIIAKLREKKWREKRMTSEARGCSSRKMRAIRAENGKRR